LAVTMPIIIKVKTFTEIFWAIIALIGIILTSSGIINAISGINYFGDVAYTSATAYSYLSAGILLLAIGVGIVTVAYLGIRGRIIIVKLV
jgi:hypothetical protein